MANKIITRNMLDVATHVRTGTGHYVLKSALRKVDGRCAKPSWAVTSAAVTLCGCIRHQRASTLLRIVTPAAATCAKCISALKKHEEAALAAAKVEEVKMLKTNDGKIFPLDARTAALEHENALTAAGKKKEFVADVERTLFTDGNLFDEELIEAFEESIAEAIANNLEFGDIRLDGFLGFFHEMLSKHGAAIRNMIILYQKIHGSFRLCRDSMLDQENGGLYL